MTSDPLKSASRPPDTAFASPDESARPDSIHSERVAELFNRYHAKLVKSLAAKTRSWEEARDIASQAFVEVLSQRPGTVDFLGAYLYRTARNLALNRLAHLSMRERKQSAVDPAQNGAIAEPEQLLVEHQEAELLHRAMEGLSPRHRMALVLRIWEELSYEDITARFSAKGIEINVRTVQRYVAHAIEHCQREIRAMEVQSRKQNQ